MRVPMKARNLDATNQCEFLNWREAQHNFGFDTDVEVVQPNNAGLYFCNNEFRESPKLIKQIGYDGKVCELY